MDQHLLEVIVLVYFKVLTQLPFQIHASADMYGLDRIDDTQKPRFSLNDQALSFFGVMAAFFAAYFYLNDNKMHWPVVGIIPLCCILRHVFYVTFLYF